MPNDIENENPPDDQSPMTITEISPQHVSGRQAMVTIIDHGAL